MNEHGRFGPIEWATSARPLPGEAVCGDGAVAVSVDDNVALFGVIDGLGHGEAAALATTRASEVLRRSAHEPVESLIKLCHRALVATRGAAMTLARIDFHEDTLQWVGVGNVNADLVAKAPNGLETRSSAMLSSGTVGFRIADVVTAQTIPIRAGHLLVMASDGLDEGHLDDIDFAASASALSERMISEHGKPIDDALVLVARHRGVSP